MTQARLNDINVERRLQSPANLAVRAGLVYIIISCIARTFLMALLLALSFRVFRVKLIELDFNFDNFITLMQLNSSNSLRKVRATELKGLYSKGAGSTLFIPKFPKLPKLH